MKIIPPTMTTEQAIRSGMCGRIECGPYLRWLKTLPCDTCGAGAPSDPSHYNGYKGMGTKAPDLFAIPQCRKCHEAYERREGWLFEVREIAEDLFLARSILYIVRAFWEGHLVWKP